MKYVSDTTPVTVPALAERLPRRSEVFTCICLVSGLAGVLVLAAKPALWLVGTWYRDGYDGVGPVAAGMALVMFCWSITSPRSLTMGAHTPSYPDAARAGPVLLLAVSAMLRLASQLLDVNVLGALLLAVDVYAVAVMCELPHRQRAVSPFWLACVFCFSLPLEPMVQRLLGYGLQHLSANVACFMLYPWVDELACHGVRLSVDGRDVLVDVPCSGAELLSLSTLIFVSINALRRGDARSYCVAGLSCVLLALAGNGLRIAILALGMVHAERLPFSVMDHIPHTLIGLACVALVTIGLWRCSEYYRSPEPVIESAFSGLRLMTFFGHRRARLTGAFLFLPLALTISALQPQPVDASPAISPPEMPLVAAGFLRELQPLSVQEKQYFTRYGGGAVRGSYGPFGLLLVSTASPLRHLHDPIVCLSGAGYAVQFLGTDHHAGESVYFAAARGGSGSSFKVRVAYLSDAGQRASSVSEVVWHWLRRPAARWTMVQRIVPEHPGVDSEQVKQWSQAVRRAFNLNSQFS